MYVINQSLEVQTESSASAIPVGIHNNVQFLGVEKKADKNGNPYLSFSFKDSEGNVLTHNEFEISPEYTTPKPGESKQDAVARKVNSMMIRIKHICTQFISPDRFVVTGNNWESFCVGVVGIMSNCSIEKPVRLKVVYNYKDYSSIPNFVPFIENMMKTPSGLRIGKSDKMVKDEVKAQAAASEVEDDILPF